jgi:hypothetical protein
MVKFNEANNDSMYKLFSTLLHQGELKWAADEDWLNELLALRVEKRSNGVIKVEVPSGAGHDDRFDSIIRAIFLAYSYQNKNNVLVGESLQNLFNNIDPVTRSMKPGHGNNQRLLQKMKAINYQSDLNIRNPGRNANAARIMRGAGYRSKR